MAARRVAMWMWMASACANAGMPLDPWPADGTAAQDGGRSGDAGADAAAEASPVDASAPAFDARAPEPQDAGTSAPATILRSAVVGGVGGTAFDDSVAFQPPVTVASLMLSGASRLDRVALLHDDGTTLSHGGVGGDQLLLQLEPGEVLTSARLCSGERNGTTRVFYARFETNLGHTLAAGTETADCVVLDAPQDHQIAGFFGRADAEMDALGLLYVPR